jgi:amino acid adenylation domain-containing protein
MTDFAARVAALPPEKQKQLVRLVERDGGVSNAWQLSLAQERLWFLDQLAPGSPLYNIPAAVRFSGELDAAALARSWSELVRRHEVLRTSFATLAGLPLQVVSPASAQALPLVDLQGLEPGKREETARTLAVEQAWRPFDLQRGCLARITLLRLGAEDHVVLVTMHHIISDGWSVGVFLRELAALYAASRKGRPSPLPELPIQYKDFARWQRKLLSGERLEAEIEHWRQRLAGAPPEIELPTDRPRPAVQSFRGAMEGLPDLSGALSEELDGLAARRGATLFQTLLAAFATLLMRHSRQSDIVLGTAVANRNRPEIEGLIGFFVNTLVLRLDLSGDPTFHGLLERVREAALDDCAHQDLPFEKLVGALHPERSLSRNPIFQAAFDLQNLPAAVELPGLRSGSLDLESRTSKFDLRLSMKETPRGLQGSLEYASDLFDRTTVQRLGEHLRALLAGIAADGARRLSELDLLTPPERHQLLHEWNETRLEESWPRTAHAMFEEQAGRAPETLAVVLDEESLTYGELDRRANRLAHHLISLGAGPEALVGLCVERSLDMIVGILGVLKAGAAYLPLDPGNPRERLRFMIEDSRAPLLLTRRSLLEKLPGSAARLVLLDSDRDAIDRLPASPPAVSVNGENLAYVIYTSGSTGRPKGAWLTHRSLCNLASAFVDGFDLRPGSQVLQFSFFNFDASVVEIFMTLLGGTTLHLARQEDLVPGPGLVSLLRERRITAAIIPPSVLAAVPEADLPDLRTLIVAGEACSAELVARWSERRSFFNAYGPTEATVCASFTPCAPGGGRPHIGRPIANVRTHVLDSLSHPVPAGVPGELHIGGVSVGRGYLGRPDLTADKFVPDPFGEPGARLYRTGDLARLLPDGNLDFLGRIDHQVKVRGFRIEPGEIEEVLRQHPAVRQAAVAVLGERIAAYVVAAGEEAPERELRGFLEERLPRYMVPSAFVRMEALPLNSSGKLDLKALPDPAGRRLAPEAGYRPPQTVLEKTIAEIWSDVLGVEKVGLYDNFFDLGGHSLLLARVHDRLRTALGFDVALMDLFTYPTVSSLAGHLHGATAEPEPAAPAVARTEDTDGIAVIGMSLRVPGSRSLDEFWANLCNGVETIAFFTDEELLAAGVEPGLLRNPRYVKAGSYLEGMDLFDAAFFGINPRQATLMDPQQRIFLECAWEALENAGYAGDSYPGSIGLYAGAGANTYLYSLIANPGFLESVGTYQAALGNDKDHLATRTSYLLDLQGPSVTVQTSCSTSLVAVHLACRSLLGGECEVVLAGGVSVDARGKSGYLPQEGGIRSPDGHCRAFDAKAAGTMNASGAGIVVLKRLGDALRDGDTIHAVIRGSAINNDGSSKVGYTAPRVEGQAQVIRDAQVRAGVTADQISYVEAHGTGTELGDPIEVAALTRAFRATTGRRQYCALGSLKASTGHLDAAAGVAGLIKAVLAVERGMIPPSLHFEEPNPKIDFPGSPFFVNDRLAEWRSDGPRRAGVSSFGIGGTNAHVVLEEAPPVPEGSPSRPAHLLVLSARTAGALDAACANLSLHLARHLESGPDQDLADVEHTLQAGRRLFPYRRAVVCRDTAEAVEALSGRRPDLAVSLHREQRDRPLVFLFTGHGSQYVDMGRELYENEPAYREAIDRCAELLLPALGLDFRRILYPEILYPEPGEAEPAAERLGAMALAQPILFAVEYALARLWTSWVGLPQAMIGHSMGEYVAACLSGVLSLEGALTLVAARGRLMEETAAGSMLAVALPQDELLPLLGPELSLAAVNGPERSVVSGPAAAVERLQLRLAERGTDCRRLHISIAGHSSLMDPILPRFAEEVARVDLKPPAIPYVSNLTGTWITAAQATDPAYWVDHLRHTVRFADGLREIWRSTDGVLLEVGPGRSLTTLAAQHPERPSEREAFSSLSHAQERSPDLGFVLTTLGRLWASGVRVDWQAFHTAGRRKRVPLPTYPFERQRYWVPGVPGVPPVGRQAAAPAERFQALSWSRAEEPLRPGVRPERWLVFVDERGLGAALARRLTEQGCRVATVRAGERFARLGDGELAIDPARAEDYRELVRELRSSGFVPQAVLHGWSVTAEPSANVETCLDLGLRSLQRLAEALDGQVPAVILSNHVHSVTGEEPLCPGKAAVLGLCAPGQAYRAVDLVLPEAGSAAEARLLDALVADLAAEAAPSITAYRGRHRWVRVESPVRLEEGGETQDGAWLVVGGRGGAASGFARHLARRGTKLALVGPVAEDVPAAEGRVHVDLAAEAESIAEVEQILEKELALVTLADVEGLEDLLDRLCASYVVEYLRREGIDLSAGRVYQRNELRRSLEILPQLERLYERFLALLAEDGLLTLDGDRIELAPRAAQAPDPRELYREAEARFPQFGGLFRLLDHCAGHYGPALRGAMPAIEVLYPEGRNDLLEQVERDTAPRNQKKLYVQTLCRVVAGLAREARSRGLRILEVGAGSGVLTRSLLRALEGESYTYVFSDISTAFVRAAEARAAEQGLENVAFRVLDISRDLAGQGIDPGSFDVILGLNVVHATPSLGETVANLRQALAPGGLLGLVETVKPARWIDMTWGLAEGWWYFEDCDLRPVSPLAPPEVWERVLREQGFRHTEVFPREEGARRRKDSALILGQQAPESGEDRIVRLPDLGAARERLGAIHGIVAEVEGLEGALALRPLLDREPEVALLSVVQGEPAAELLGAYARQAHDGGRRVRLLRWTGAPESAEDGGQALLQVLHGNVPEVRVAGRSAAVEEAPSVEAAPVEPGAPALSEVERRIAALWEELLGRRVGLHDNFFDLGGDSLIALNLTSKIRQQWQVELPLRRILEAPTVAGLAAAVEAGLPRPAAVEPTAPEPRQLPATVVEIQAGSASRPPFFTVHAAGGNVLCYYNLARHLGPEQPVYALQAPGIEGEQEAFDRLEDLAAFHLAAIRAAQPHGPYLLGGWSAGGTVSYEIARQLEALGERVALVALMDTYAPVEDYEFDGLKLLMWQVWRFRLPIETAELAGLATFEEQLGLLVRRAFELGIVPGHITAEEVRRILSVEIANLKAMLAYRPGPCSGGLTFFRSREGTDFGGMGDLFPWINGLDHAAAWEVLTGCPVEVHEIPGDHRTLMDEPHVKVLGERLRFCIERIDSGSNRTEVFSEGLAVDAQGGPRN